MKCRLAYAQVIASYLADKYSGEGFSFELRSPEDRANDLLARRVHDLYIGPIQVHHHALCHRVRHGVLQLSKTVLCSHMTCDSTKVEQDVR